MSFWISIALIVIVVFVLLYVMTRQMSARVTTRLQAAEALYQSQIAEIDAEAATGRLTEAAATRLKTELSRSFAREEKIGETSFTTGPTRPLAITLALGLLGAVGFYAYTGAPGLIDLPFDTRQEMLRPSQARAYEILEKDGALAPLPEIDPQYATLIDELRTVLETRPDEPEGNRLLASTMYNLGHFQEAAKAQAKYIEIIGDDATAEDYALLGEAQILAVNGYVSPEAEAAIRKALQLDKNNLPATFYAGLTMRQEEDFESARQIWEGMLPQVEAPEWRAEIERQLAALPSLKGPSETDIANAADMSQGDQQAMIENMVSNLSERLASEGGTPEEWAQLLRALTVLNRTEARDAILQEARTTFAGNDAALSVINQAVGE